MLPDLGNDRVCLDSTHGITNRGFELVTVLVVDKYNEGEPVAFLITSTVNTINLSKFFTAIKTALEVNLTPKAFMSDDACSKELSEADEALYAAELKYRKETRNQRRRAPPNRYGQDIEGSLDSKKEMEMLLDDLVEGKLLLSDVPLLQIAGGSTASRHKIKVIIFKAHDKHLNEIQRRRLEMAKQKESGVDCENCGKLDAEFDTCRKQLATLTKKIQELEGDLSSVKEGSEKYKKYKGLKGKFSTGKSSDYSVIGDNTLILKDNLAMCRTSNYSKYVGDILDVLFNPEVLRNSVIRGTKKCP
ncbi:hypothetical protein JTE90_023442 [Oedothorax gibbosus]|uniref:MULE transposase domain-containing protein n=1 Tax=Oedothorax gibbosus TaxID=931172 RepID=A0AAV6TZH2_9ARAC|nr:hypothetical protein JTE90_023442 [Oedothorax gibbosus]